MKFDMKHMARQWAVTFEPQCHLQWSEESSLRKVVTTFLHLLSFAIVLVTAPFSFFFVLKVIRSFMFTNIFFLLKRIPEYERAVVLGTTLSLATIRWRLKKYFFWNIESFLLLSASYTTGVLASYSSCPSWKRSKGCVPIILFSIILLCAHHLVEESYWHLLFTFHPHAWPLSRWTFEHVCLRSHPSRFSPRTRLAWPLMYNT